MNTVDPTTRFWHTLSQQVRTAIIGIDRPRGSCHPRYPAVIYPLDYGYLQATTAGDGAGIDIWIGSLSSREVTGIVCTVDAELRNAEIKVLLGCTPEEVTTIFGFPQPGQPECTDLRPEDQ